ncbi:MAG: DUF1330 domain-containing protein [Xanthobacteraceae bacterium]
MKAQYGFGIALLAGVALGAGAVSALHAQATPPAYYIALIDPIDQDAYMKEYASKATGLVTQHGGKFISRGGQIVELIGPAPKRVAIAEFNSMDALKAWWNSNEMKALAPVREKYGRVRSFAVAGESK